MKVFRKARAKPKQKSTQNVSTVPLSAQQIHLIDTDLHFEPRQLVTGCAQSVGKQREHNEDSLLTFSATVAGDPNSLPLGFFVVADGMGGHQYGEVASSAVVRTMAGYVLRKLYPSFFSLPVENLDESLQEIMRAAVQEAQRAVLREAPGSGTTVTAVLVLGQQVTLAHVGDSRAYAIHPDGRMEAITRDHSLVKRLVELGQITSEEATLHPQRNVLYRALGQGDTLEPDIISTSFPQPGFLLLCSDGLWSVVPEEDIFQIVKKAASLQSACQDLVAAANEAGGPDNITAILIQLLG